jgi:hypothetical protein
MCILETVLLCTILVADFARFKKKTPLKPGRISPVSVLLDSSMIISKKTASNLNHKSGIAEQMDENKKMPHKQNTPLHQRKLR